MPLLTGAMVCGTPAFWSLAMHCVPPGGRPPPPLRPLVLLLLLLLRRAARACWRCREGTSTPMNPEAPILTVELPLPSMI